MASLYYLGNRPVERMFALVLTMVAIFWFAINHQSMFSGASFVGLLYGVIVCFIVRMSGVSAMTEGSVWMVVTILIGIKYGIKAAGMSVLGWLLLSFAMVLAIIVVNRILWRQHPKT
jgi:hypothetical protein